MMLKNRLGKKKQVFFRLMSLVLDVFLKGSVCVVRPEYFFA